MDSRALSTGRGWHPALLAVVAKADDVGVGAVVAGDGLVLEDACNTADGRRLPWVSQPEPPSCTAQPGPRRAYHSGADNQCGLRENKTARAHRPSLAQGLRVMPWPPGAQAHLGFVNGCLRPEGGVPKVAPRGGQLLTRLLPGTSSGGARAFTHQALSVTLRGRSTPTAVQLPLCPRPVACSESRSPAVLSPGGAAALAL